MSTARDQHRADQIFTDALDRPASSRAAFIETACGEDDSLRTEVQELLDHYSSAEDALTHTRTTHQFSGRPDVEQVDLRTDKGRTVGTCRLDGRLPDDGLFEQWATRRHDDRPAAILTLARQRLSLEEARSVAMHAEMLLRLDHPGLPRMLEAGTVDLGRGPEAFFLIERIEGDPVCEGPAGSTSELRKRLRMLESICEAVQELHFHGLAHGRLIPSRLVAGSDSTATRVSDPGILAALARAVPDSAAAEELAGRDSAPERRVLPPADLDARIDVFDLGRLLQGWCDGVSAPLAPSAAPIPPNATAHDRQDRYRCAGELGDAIGDLLTPGDAPSGVEGTTTGLTPMAITVIALLAAAAGCAIGALLF